MFGLALAGAPTDRAAGVVGGVLAVLNGLGGLGDGLALAGAPTDRAAGVLGGVLAVLNGLGEAALEVAGVAGAVGLVAAGVVTGERVVG